MTCLFSVCRMTKKSTMIQWQSEPRSKTVAFFYFKDFTGTPVVWERTYFLSRMDPVLAVSSSRVLIITSMQDQNCVKKNKKRKTLNKSACVFIDNDNLTLLITIFYRPVVSILIKNMFSLCLNMMCCCLCLCVRERVTDAVLLSVHKCPRVTRLHSAFLLCAHPPIDDSSAGRIWGLLPDWKGCGTMTKFRSSASVAVWWE